MLLIPFIPFILSNKGGGPAAAVRMGRRRSAYRSLPRIVSSTMASLKYLGESLFILSTVGSIVRWIGRTMRETIPPSAAELSPEMELPYMLPALLQVGAAPPEAIARMSPSERAALYRATFEEGDRAESRRVPPGASWSATCAECGFPLGAGTAPVGYVTRCPHCGKARVTGNG